MKNQGKTAGPPTVSTEKAFTESEPLVGARLAADGDVRIVSDHHFLLGFSSTCRVMHFADQEKQPFGASVQVEEATMTTLTLTTWQRRRLERQLRETLDARVYRRTLAILEVAQGELGNRCVPFSPPFSPRK